MDIQKMFIFLSKMCYRCIYSCILYIPVSDCYSNPCWWFWKEIMLVPNTYNRYLYYVTFFSKYQNMCSYFWRNQTCTLWFISNLMGLYASFWEDLPMTSYKCTCTRGHKITTYKYMTSKAIWCNEHNPFYIWYYN